MTGLKQYRRNWEWKLGDLDSSFQEAEARFRRQNYQSSFNTPTNRLDTFFKTGI